MSIVSKKRIAASILKVGVNRVRIDPERIQDVVDAVTREDIKRLIKEGAIWAVPKRGISSGRRKMKRKRRGPGSKKGSKGARMGKKERWVRQVRALRRYLKALKARRRISNEIFKQVYKKVKGGEIKTVRRLKEIIAEMERR